jgi:hypothetical protein
VRFFFFFLLILACAPLHASYIELSNGDRLMGELVRIEGDHVIWRSANFGEQRIHKHHVKNLFSNRPLKINGNDLPCIVESMEQENIVYYCGSRHKLNRVSLLSIKVMTPFDDFVEQKFLHQGRLGVSGAYSRGNEVREEWNIQGEFTARRGEWRHTLRGEFSETSWWHSPPSLKWQSRYTIDWFFRERWFWFNNLTLGKEEQRGVDSYTSLASGTGYQLWESQQTALSIKAGMAFFDEQYMEPSVIQQGFDPSDRYSAGQLGADFRYTLPGGIGFFHNNEFTQSMNDSDKWFWKSTTGLNATIVGRIYSEIKFDHNRDNQPQPGRQALDKRLTVGVGYKW